MISLVRHYCPAPLCNTLSRDISAVRSRPSTPSYQRYADWLSLIYPPLTTDTVIVVLSLIATRYLSV